MVKTAAQIKDYIDALVLQGVGVNTAAPVLYRMLWRLGINITPPFNQTFIKNFVLTWLFMSVLFLIIFPTSLFLFWGPDNWQLAWEIVKKPRFFPLVFSLGFLSGLLGASRIRYRAKHLNVPKW